MRMWKKIIAVVMAIGMALGCFACGGDKKENEKQEGTTVKNGIIDNIDELVLDETEFDLVHNGATDYKILLPEESTSSERMAAEELTNIFFESTDITLETVAETQEGGKYISIGNTSLYESSGLKVDSRLLKSSGFMINRKGENILINGATDQAKIYGVYTFCEKQLDYMYFYADEIQYVKTANKKLLDFDITVIPTFDGRSAFSYDTFYDYEHALRLKSNNSINLDWPEHCGERSFWSELHDQSTVFQLLPLIEYREAHKDWFWVAPERADLNFNELPQNTAETYVKESSQMCFTKAYYADDDSGKLMFDTFMDNLINKYIAVEKDKKFFMIGIADNGGMCDCDRCVEDYAKYKMSGVQMRFLNKVAAAVEDWIKNESGTPDREIVLVTFAYLGVFEPPTIVKDGVAQLTDPSVKAHPSICVRIAPLHEASYYWRLDDREHNSYMANVLDGWKITADKFAIWDYRVHYDLCVAQMPYWSVVKSNLELYKEIGVVDIFSQGISQTSGIPFSRLDDYVRSRLMFNINADEQKLTDAFIDAYYKNAAPYIREYRDYLRMHYETHIIPQKYVPKVYATYPDLLVPKHWPIETLKQMEHIFDKAYASIETCDEATKKLLKDRIDVESRFYRYAQIELYENIYLTGSALQKAIDDFVAANQVNPLQQHAVRVDISQKIAEWRNKAK